MKLEKKFGLPSSQDVVCPGIVAGRLNDTDERTHHGIMAGDAAPEDFSCIHNPNMFQILQFRNY